MNQRVLGLITARGGSKSIPKKNIAPLGGRPLLAYTCDAALNCPGVHRTVLSTDDEEIASAGRGCGVEVPFMRPPGISGDSATSIDVALHAVDWLAENEGWQAEVLVLLQPTSPFRSSAHLEEGLRLFHDQNAETVVSVTPVPHRFSPYSIMEMSGGELVPFWKDPLPFDRFHRQSVPTLYARNGPAVLISRVPIMKERRSFYGDRVLPYLMSERDSTDIDHPLDLLIAEALLNAGTGGGLGSH